MRTWRRKMIQTIISNNCAGGAILHDLGMEFKTPTINLQILPEQYAMFCRSLPYYLKSQLTEAKNFTPFEETMLRKMFGGVPDMPIGLLDGFILVCFQHYPTFEEAKAKWEERKKKVDYEHTGHIFHARGPEYKEEAELFMKLDLPNKLCLTQGFDVDGAVRFDGEGFEAVNGKLRITQVYDFRRWVNEKDHTL